MFESRIQNQIAAFLPPADDSLTLLALIEGYANYWCSLPSFSGYARYYDTDGVRYLWVWEGYPGKYDYYGDMYSDGPFYNDVMKGLCHDMSFFKPEQGGITVSFYNDNALRGMTEDQIKNRYKIQSSSVSDPTKYRIQDHYNTLADLRADIIAYWGYMQLTLGEEGRSWRQLAATYAKPVRELMEAHGRAWVEAGEQRCFRVFTYNDYTYLSLWVGAADMLLLPTPGYIDGRPLVQSDIHHQYAEFRVGFKRIPVRFQLDARQWTVVDGYYADISGGTIQTYEALKAVVTRRLSDLLLD